MRILFDSKLPQFKSPFGTLVPGQLCTLHIHIPETVRTTAVTCIFTEEDGSPAFEYALTYLESRDAYDIYRGEFSLPRCGLFFYYFRIDTQAGSFRLFKYGDDTNMEDGGQWQLSCVPADFTVPDWAKGGVLYQIFPDRFHKSGQCDLTGKLEPYTVHENWNEEVGWQPDANGKILNNDFFGGNFRGITEKMDYIASLGTAVLYLNPIGKSFSNHRYDTGDYKTPDPMLGTMADFTAMCTAAHARGIRVILDGVYSHTGADSLYFDRYGTFGGSGAYCRTDSPYFSWFQFSAWPDKYKCWWDFNTLPTVNKMDPAFISYMITDENSVVAHWLNAGADGFRLDVADELPNAFLDLLKKRIRQIRPDALLIGEVWEDASNKIAYDIRKRYFVDGVLDSVMNYPFRTAILDFLKEADDGRRLRDTVMTIAENYPPQVLYCNMNLLGTHDTPRILTALVDDYEGTREENAIRHLSWEQHLLARQRLLAASFLQFTLPGMPAVYYGDEAGMEGAKDPFNRRTYPWGQEDTQLLAHYQKLGALRRELECLREGSIEFLCAGDRRIAFRRSLGKRQVTVYLNCSADAWIIPGKPLLFGHSTDPTAEQLCIAPMGFCVTE